jgi:hypothetical protein
MTDPQIQLGVRKPEDLNDLKELVRCADLLQLPGDTKVDVSILGVFLSTDLDSPST